MLWGSGTTIWQWLWALVQIFGAFFLFCLAVGLLAYGLCWLKDKILRKDTSRNPGLFDDIA